LVALEKQLIGMGVQPSPVTNQFCEIYPEKCFPITEDYHMQREEQMVMMNE